MAHVLPLPEPGSRPPSLPTSLKPSTFDPVPSRQLATRVDLGIQAPPPSAPLTEVEAEGAPRALGAPSPGKGDSTAYTGPGSRVETGIRDNRKSLPYPVPHAAAALQGSQLRAFRGWGPELGCTCARQGPES